MSVSFSTPSEASARLQNAIKLVDSNPNPTLPERVWLQKEFPELLKALDTYNHKLQPQLSDFAAKHGGGKNIEAEMHQKMMRKGPLLLGMAAIGAVGAGIAGFYLTGGLSTAAQLLISLSAAGAGGFAGYYGTAAANKSDLQDYYQYLQLEKRAVDQLSAVKIEMEKAMNVVANGQGQIAEPHESQETGINVKRFLQSQPNPTAIGR